MSPTYKEFRDVMYNYHRRGLDQMSTNLKDAKNEIVLALLNFKEMNRIKSLLGNFLCESFDYVINNYPTLLDIEIMFKHLSDHNVDLVISIGGGSSIDIAKIYSSCNLEVDSLTDISQLLNSNSSDCIMSIAVPTTAGSGAESTKFATIWSKESKEKLSFENENLIPDYVYLIPECAFL